MPEACELFCDRCLVAIAIGSVTVELARLTYDLKADPLLHAGDDLLSRCKNEATRLALLAHNAFLAGDMVVARTKAGEALRSSCARHEQASAAPAGA
jgi:hypothetical protein